MLAATPLSEYPPFVARTLRYFRSFRAAIVLIAALSSVLSALPQADCCLPAAVAAVSDAETHEGHASHEATDTGAPVDEGCSHDNHGASCQQHCATPAVSVAVALRPTEVAPVALLAAPASRPTTVTLAADPPPPRA